MINDDSDKNNSFEQLGKSDLWYKIIFEGVREGILVVDAETKKFFYANPAMCQMFGYAQKEFLMLNVLDLHPKEFQSRVLAEFDAQARGEKILAEDIPCLSKTGTIFYVDIRTSIITFCEKKFLVGFFNDITLRKHMEEALHLNMAELNLALKSAKMGVWQFNLVEGKRIFDDQVCALLGINPANFRGSAEEFFAVVHPEDRDRIKIQMEQSIRNGGPYDVDYRFFLSDGSIRYITARGELIHDANGHPQMIIGIIWDITDRKQTEEALRQSEEQFRSIVDNIGIGIALISPDMEILSLNNQMKKWNPHIDLKDKHTCYRSFNNPPRQEICSYCPTVKTLQDGSVHESVTETPMGGQLFNFRIISSPIKDKAGKVIAAVEMVEDISVRKQAEEAILQSEEKLRAITDSTQNAILMMDPKGNISFWNPAAQRMLGYRVEEALGMNLHQMLSPGRFHQAQEMAYPEYQRTGKGAAIGKTLELAAIRKDGVEIAVELSLSSIHREDGWHAVGIIRDITERKEKELALKKMRQAYDETQAQLFQTGKLATLGEMAAGIAHEINQPLGVIDFTAEFLHRCMEKKILTDDKIEKGIKDVKASVNRMKRTIDHIRMFARQEQTDFEVVNVEGTIDSALILLEEQLRQHDIEVTQFIAPRIPSILGDPHQLEQVWINFICNARDAMDEKQKLIQDGKIADLNYKKTLVITVSYKLDLKCVHISFADSGMGVDEEYKQKIFDPFFTTKEVGKGTGLGLSISYGIIEKHKGKIEVAGKKGEGASFGVYLPVQEIETR
ncbi:MAG: PAS domain S-box protein [Candidatus Omnitrophica bacterium]|nr:PAS domain S-box protein [Candidatus Omnitrophota bacterium]